MRTHTAFVCILCAALSWPASGCAQPADARPHDERSLPEVALVVRAFSADRLTDPGASDIRVESLPGGAVRTVRSKQGFLALGRVDGGELLLPCRPGGERRVVDDLVRVVSLAGARSLHIDLFPGERNVVGQVKVRAYTSGGGFQTSGFMPLPADLRAPVARLVRAWGLQEEGESWAGDWIDSGDPCARARSLAESAVGRYRSWTLTCDDVLALEEAVARCGAAVRFPDAPWTRSHGRVKVTPVSVTEMLGAAAQRHLDIADRSLRFEEVGAFDKNIRKFREILGSCDARFRGWFEEPDGRTPRFILDERVATPEWIEEVRNRIAD